MKDNATIKMDFNPDTDASNISKLENNKNNIIEYLISIGNSSAALFLKDKVQFKSYSNDLNKINNNQINITQEVKELNGISNKILKKLDDIEKGMHDEQDTSIKDAQPTPMTVKDNLSIIRDMHNKKEEPSFISKVLSGIFGTGMLAFLSGFAAVGALGFIKSIMATGWNFIKDKVLDIAKKIYEPLKKVIEFIGDKLSKFIKYIGSQVGLDFDSKDKKGVRKKGSNKFIGKTSLGNIAKVGLSSSLLLSPTTMGDSSLYTSDDDAQAMIEAEEEEKYILDVNEGKIKGLTEHEIRIDKLVDRGIIDKDFFSKDEIENWDSLNSLSQEDLTALSNHSGFSQETLEKISVVLYKKIQENQKIKPAPDLISRLYTMKNINPEFEFAVARALIAEHLKGVSKNKDGEYQFRSWEIGKKEKYEELKSKYDVAFNNYKNYLYEKRKNEKDTVKIGNNILTIDEAEIFNNMTDSQKNIDKFMEMKIKKQTIELGEKKLRIEEDTSLDIFKDFNIKSLMPDFDFDKDVDSTDEELMNRIKDAEGLRSKPYWDVSAWTIGYGHQIKPGEEYLMNGITEEEAEELFKKDFVSYKEAARKIPSFAEHPKYVQDALVDMTYNMGNDWYKGWPNFVQSLIDKDYQLAASSILESKYITQVGERGENNMRAILRASTKSTKTTDVKVENKQAVNPVKINDSQTDSVNTQTSKESTQNVLKLGKEDSIQSKNKQAQSIDATSKQLITNSKVSNTNNNIINNTNNITKSSNDESTHSLYSTFVM